MSGDIERIRCGVQTMASMTSSMMAFRVVHRLVRKIENVKSLWSEDVYINCEWFARRKNPVRNKE